jgi:hypothetical protein
MVVERPAVADGYAGNILLGVVNASLRPELPDQLQVRYPIVDFSAQDLRRQAPLTLVPGNALIAAAPAQEL